ncbi:MAG: mechanosensitive ion channel family protein [Rhodothermales bacterium]
MGDLWSQISGLVTLETAASVLRAAVLIIVGLLAARIVSRALASLVAREADRQKVSMVRRLSFYSIAGLFFIAAMVELGFNFGVILGAAGILSVAIGFASQTSASNVISGLFLMGEKPFSIGDVIKVGETLGEVLSIDLLSVKLRTFDNLFVRIANENLIKSEITNLTRFPIRRIDLQVGVAYKEDMRKVMKILDEVADANPLILADPSPLFIFKGYGDSALEFQFSVWTLRENYLQSMNSIKVEIKEAFDANDIEIPFPHRTLYPGSVAEPFRVEVIKN